MNEPILVTKAEPGAGGRMVVLSPLVGVWTDHPHAGALLGPGSRIGVVAQLNRRFVLVLPDGAAGRVAAGLPRNRALAVDHGHVLFELSPVGTGDRREIASGVDTPGHPAGAATAAGSWAVLSPTDGVFYRGPSPAAPPFVEPGTKVRTGDPVGLVEVMKTFNQIAFGGPGFPEEAVVAEVRCADGEEVRAGQVLIVVR
jgi:biotin carboxyl carrier protein